MNRIRSFLNKRGQSATEYILILAVLVVIVLIASRVFKDKFKGVVEGALNKVTEGVEKAGSESDSGI